MQQIKKVVIPAAGIGSRFLPYTKAVPKELLPIMQRPALDFILHEAHKAGIKDCCLVLSEGKEAIRSYLSPSKKLEHLLQEKNMLDDLVDLDCLIESMSFSWVYQQDPLGLGHAVLQAEQIIGNNPFVVMLPDDILVSEKSILADLMHAAVVHQAAVIAVMPVPKDQVSAYGIVACGEQIREGVSRVVGIVEKPSPHEAPSNLAVIGRYVLPPLIFQHLKKLKPGTAGELQLTDAIASLIEQGFPVIACTIDAYRFDVGTPLGWLQAVAYHALHDKDYQDDARALLTRLLE